MERPRTIERISQAERERRRAFSNSAERYAAQKIRSAIPTGTAELKPIETSHVNFVYATSLADEPVIVKFNLFGRSMLYAYEQFQALGPEKFDSLLENYTEQNDQFEMQREIGSLDLLRSNGIRVPELKLFVPPNVAVYERVPGPTLEEHLRTGRHSPEVARGLAETLLRIHRIEPPLNARASTVDAADGTVAIKDDNFNDVILLREVHPEVSQLLTEGKRVLTHGDFKPNNILIEEARTCILDPRLQVSAPESDAGKLILRTYAAAYASKHPKSGLLFSQEFVNAYCRAAGEDRQEFERKAIIWGLIELHHLLARPLRHNIDLLGSEMLELAAIKGRVEVLFAAGLQRRAHLQIDDLYRMGI